MEYNTMVFSLGFRPDRRLYESLLGKVPELYLIGDAREARNIMGAVWDAYEVARGI
jgi:2-enoate reductase